MQLVRFVLEQLNFIGVRTWGAPTGNFGAEIGLVMSNYIRDARCISMHEGLEGTRLVPKHISATARKFCYKSHN